MKVEKYIAYHICTNYIEDASVWENIVREYEKPNRDKTEEILENHRNTDVAVSRKNALFVCYNRDNVDLWINKKFKNQSVYIYKLELTGDLYWVDASFYEKIFKLIDTRILNQRIESIANNYWKEINPKEKFPVLAEGLFIGKITIKEVYTEGRFIEAEE